MQVWKQELNECDKIHNEFMAKFNHLEHDAKTYLSKWATDKLHEAWVDGNTFKSVEQFHRFFLNYHWN